MTFIITALAEGCSGAVSVPDSPFVLDRVVIDEAVRWRAGFVPGLALHLEFEEGAAFHIVLADADGWKSSNALFEYADDEYSPAYLCVPEELRTAFAAVLDGLQRCAQKGRVLLVLEDNGVVTAPDRAADSDLVDIVGPLTSQEFWLRHDLSELVEGSIVILER